VPFATDALACFSTPAHAAPPPSWQQVETGSRKHEAYKKAWSNLGSLLLRTGQRHLPGTAQLEAGLLKSLAQDVARARRA
jgi:hypothetical protein